MTNHGQLDYPKPGDWIIKRRYGPASEPELVNRAHHPDLLPRKRICP
ncbi:MAG: hypothetical protein IPJ61_17710 [Tessaracoccus sp.]|nr:hypothetical protein [Tessaracoccus sp.]MBK7822841.1 hypothetical protein [Tessaracoccus sp.]